MPLILDGTNGVSGVDGSAGTPSYQGTDTNTGIFYPAADTIAFAEGGTEVMRIDSSGNVGIGTSSPVAPLTVASSTTLAAGSPSLVLRGESNTERIAIFAAGGAGAGTPVLLAASTRGTIASPTAIQSGDQLGYYQLGGYDGSGYVRSAWIAGFAAENYSATNRGSNLVFSTTPIGSTIIAERMRIDSSGNVGIGTSSPSYTLQVSTSGEARISNPANAISYWSLQPRGNNFLDRIVTGTNGAIQAGANLLFETNGANERMRIDSSGNVGIGTNSPGVRLEVSGTIRSTSATIADAATITPTAGTTNQYTVTALAQAATIAAPSGTPIDGQKLTIRLKDNGVARALTWTTSSGAYRAIGVTLPTTTSAGKVTYVGCIYNSQDTFWDVIAVTTQA